MIKLGEHCWYYTGDPIVTYAAHYDRDAGDGTHRIVVTLENGSHTAIVAAECDPAKPQAGCWSVVPA